ncbi:hypothetical protein ACFL35_18355, partial [Candidatus Riflebacteria bacterium]
PVYARAKTRVTGMAMKEAADEGIYPGSAGAEKKQMLASLPSSFLKAPDLELKRFKNFEKSIRLLESQFRKFSNLLTLLQMEKTFPRKLKVYPLITRIQTRPLRIKGGSIGILEVDHSIPEDQDYRFKFHFEDGRVEQSRDGAAIFRTPQIPGSYKAKIQIYLGPVLIREEKHIFDVYQSENISFSPVFLSNKIAALHGRIYRLKNSIAGLKEKLARQQLHSSGLNRLLLLFKRKAPEIKLSLLDEISFQLSSFPDQGKIYFKLAGKEWREFSRKNNDTLSKPVFIPMKKPWGGEIISLKWKYSKDRVLLFSRGFYIDPIQLSRRNP